MFNNNVKHVKPKLPPIKGMNSRSNLAVRKNSRGKITLGSKENTASKEYQALVDSDIGTIPTRSSNRQNIMLNV